MESQNIDTQRYIGAVLMPVEQRIGSEKGKILDTF
jgi:hypothetical protein